MIIAVGLGLALMVAGLAYVALVPRESRLHIAPGGAAIKRAPKRKLSATREPPTDARTGPPQRDRTAQFGRR